MKDLLGVLCLSVVCGATAGAQQLLDRVLARVGSSVITRSDLSAAIGLGLVEPASGPDAEGVSLEQFVQRQVLLAEVARFPAPAPAEAAIDELATAMKTRAGAALDELVRSTGIDEARIRDLARDTLRIQGYVRQRFGAASTLNDPDVRQWMRDVRARATVVEPGASR
jgi:hypothetical protein